MCWVVKIDPNTQNECNDYLILKNAFWLSLYWLISRLIPSALLLQVLEQSAISMWTFSSNNCLCRVWPLLQWNLSTPHQTAGWRKSHHVKLITLKCDFFFSCCQSKFLKIQEGKKKELISMANLPELSNPWNVSLCAPGGLCSASESDLPWSH